MFTTKTIKLVGLIGSLATGIYLCLTGQTEVGIGVITAGLSSASAVGS